MFSNGPVQTTAGIDVIAGQKQQVVYIFKYERFLSGLEKDRRISYQARN